MAGRYLPPVIAPLRSQTRFPVSISLVLAAVLVLVGTVLLVDDEPEVALPPAAPASVPDPGPEPEPEPEPEAEPEPPPPVSGEATIVEVVDLSVHGRRIFGESRPENDPIAPDDAAIVAFGEEVGAWLDGHLTDLQLGGTGSVTGLTGPTHRTRLTTPAHQVESASYALTVYARGGPEWAVAAVEVRRGDGSTRTAELVFVPGDGGVLVAADGDGAAPPSMDRMEPA